MTGLEGIKTAIARRKIAGEKDISLHRCQIVMKTSTTHNSVSDDSNVPMTKSTIN